MYTFIERSCCPVCGGVEHKELYAEPFATGATWEFLKDYYENRLDITQMGEARYVLLRCAACKLIYQRFVLAEEGLSDLYERAIDPQASLAKRTDADESYARGLWVDSGYVMRFFSERRPEQLDVLDFGMGWGHWCVGAKRHGYNVFGAELSEVRKDYALQNGVKLCAPLEKDNDQLFDFINTDQVVEHLTDPLKILSSLAQKLRKGGVIKIFVPNSPVDYRAIKAGRWRPAKDAFHPLEHVNGFNRFSIDVLARRAGLRALTLAEMVKAKGIRGLTAWTRRAIGDPNWYFRRD